ncbi:MAG: divalent metal cation transporter [Candidatus Saccharimonadales bacterium]
MLTCRYFTSIFMAALAAWFIVIVCTSMLNETAFTEVIRIMLLSSQLLVKEFQTLAYAPTIIFDWYYRSWFTSCALVAGSSSYAISESLHWKEGLHKKFKRAVGFYGVIIFATLVGLAINFLGIDPIKALVFSAVFNGVAAVPLLLLIAKIGNSKEIMGSHKNGVLTNVFVRVAFVIMLGASLFMFYALIKGM